MAAYKVLRPVGQKIANGEFGSFWDDRRVHFRQSPINRPDVEIQDLEKKSEDVE